MSFIMLSSCFSAFCKEKQVNTGYHTSQPGTVSSTHGLVCHPLQKHDYVSFVY